MTPPKSIGGLAVWWGVGERTIKRLRKLGAPLGDDTKMMAWLPLQKNIPQAMYQRGEARASGVEPKDEGSTGASSQADWKAFVEQHETAKKEGKNEAPKEALELLIEHRDFAGFCFKSAAKANNKADMKFFAGLLATFEGVIHDAQLRAKKLGIDQGDLFQRTEVERIVFALAYWLLRSTDQHLDALSGKLKALAPGLEAVAVRAVLEPELLSDRFLVPMAQAAKMQNGVSLPDWLVAKMRESCGDFLENGEKEFDAH